MRKGWSGCLEYLKRQKSTMDAYKRVCVDQRNDTYVSSLIFSSAIGKSPQLR